MAPVAIPPPTTPPMVAIPEAMAAAPVVPAAPADAAKVAPKVPDVADMIVAPDPPTTADAVEAADAAVKPPPAKPTFVDRVIFLCMTFSKISELAPQAGISSQT
ncbi:hypothetical protein HUF19_17845 [Thalassolituus hydrocarboniclasticus]|uniref:Uncharacterized protein n=1 Tax=Thalassolituus hydrocarboniclasticus TaxID=2742796 RepID=A0ABY6AGU3_9GAMM|nr:hypothetical protein HUF19_17845 [Thalassolituus hydrocarboniclasticus]